MSVSLVWRTTFVRLALSASRKNREYDDIDEVDEVEENEDTDAGDEESDVSALVAWFWGKTTAIVPPEL